MRPRTSLRVSDQAHGVLPPQGNRAGNRAKLPAQLTYLLEQSVDDQLCQIELDEQAAQTLKALYYLEAIGSRIPRKLSFCERYFPSFYDLGRRLFGVYEDRAEFLFELATTQTGQEAIRRARRLGRRL